MERRKDAVTGVWGKGGRRRRPQHVAVRAMGACAHIHVSGRGGHRRRVATRALDETGSEGVEHLLWVSWPDRALGVAESAGEVGGEGVRVVGAEEVDAPVGRLEDEVDGLCVLCHCKENGGSV